MTMKKIMIVFLAVIVAALLSCSKEKTVNQEPVTLNFVNFYPANGADSISLYPTFDWEHENPDNIVFYYDFYLGTNSDPPLIKPDIFTNSYRPFVLHDSTTYFWKIVARDRDQNEYIGPIWSFSALNGPPTQPANPFPPEDTTIPPAPIEIRWESWELDGEPVEFDVYFGTEADPPLYESDCQNRTTDISGLENQTDYYWMIVARDELGHETIGNIWHFRAENFAPSMPSDPFPADGATNIGINFTFGWQSEDTEDDTISYDLYFGADIDPPLEMNDLTTNVLISPWQKIALAEQTLLDIYDAQAAYRVEHDTYNSQWRSGI